MRNILFKRNKRRKKNKLKENIESLESLFNTLEHSINELKKLFDSILEDKEQLKVKIQQIFTKLRSSLNEREDKILIEIDEKYDELFFNEEIIKESDSLPNKIKISLEAGKKVNKEFDIDNKLDSFINDCINIEDNIKEINKIKERINKCNLNKNTKINFFPEENEINNKFIEIIKTFGIITYNSIQSKIVSSNDWNKIEKWLFESIGNIKKYELIYRTTEHGDSLSDSFSKCKNIPNLIWIMKDKNKNIFGCFTSIKITSSRSQSKDSKCFLYSINKNKKYLPNLNLSTNMNNCSSHLVEFGNGSWEFAVGDKFLSNNSVTFINGHLFNHNLEISNNKEISLLELEVYKVLQ